MKFYCVCRSGASSWDDFIAPNPHDILGGKLRRMLGHQLKMGQTPHIRRKLMENDAQKLLGDVELAVSPQEIGSAMSVNGGLFHQVVRALDDPVSRPEEWHQNVLILSPDLELGWWCFMRDIRTVLPDGTADLVYAVLQKPYWLAPLSGPRSTLEADHGLLRTRKQILTESEKWYRFQYISVLSYSEPVGHLVELCRGFVLPNNWPHLKGRSKKPKTDESGCENHKKFEILLLK